MRGRRLLSYQDAVTILTGDGAGLTAADEALGGVLSMATGGVSDVVLSVFDARGRVLRLGRDLTTGLRESLGGVDRATRTERIAAAHTVLVITAYFDALGEVELPFHLAELELTRDEQIRIAGSETVGPGFLARLLCAEVPQPAPHLPYEHVQRELVPWFASVTRRLTVFVSFLSLWERLSEGEQSLARGVLVESLGPLAVESYHEMYARLAQEVPEFGFWSGQIEHQATRVTVRQALTGVETALAGLSTPNPPREVADSLVTGYRAALPRPILAASEAPPGTRLPTLDEGYVDPDFRVREVIGGPHGPAAEGWWHSAPVRSDLTEYLAGVLTTTASTTAPLVVLGQPGAGKSVLTKILAARLPRAGYLPVRIVLREVPADIDIQDQVEHSVRAVTGERVHWPELIRAAAGAVPVLLFDGFDELLQATGVSQSDFLTRVARFQEREADQGRPVFALVTSRTAVADRARYPEGSVALRLEPFTRRQIERWLDLWNRINASHLAGRGLRPLSAAVAAHHADLASQPLLLLMLALYDGTGNALQRGADRGVPLGEAELYEELLSSFALREVGKSDRTGSDRQLGEHAEQELQRLSLISFGMFNRRRQWITSAETERDLAALLGRPDPVQDGFRAPLGQGEIALGRFFFVQRAQAIRADQELSTYEFLHATFGEYLAARLVAHLLEKLLQQRPALAVGRSRVDDDLLYVLLSYAPLSSRQILRFVGARLTRLDAADRERLTGLLIGVLADHGDRTEHAFAEYRPDRRATAARHGVYAANLLLLVLVVGGGVRAGRLFPDAEQPAAVWHRQVLLWRSALTGEEWNDFTAVFRLRQIWYQGRRDLHIVPTTDQDLEEPVDPNWLLDQRFTGAHSGPVNWAHTTPEGIRHQMTVAGGGDDALVLHAVEPFFERMAQSVTTFLGTPRGTAGSLAHALSSLWLGSGLGVPEEELLDRYRDCLAFVECDPLLMGAKTHRLLLRQLRQDVERLPADAVVELLRSSERCSIDSIDTVGLEARLKVALTALDVHGVRPALLASARHTVDRLAQVGLGRLLELAPRWRSSGPSRLLLAALIGELLPDLSATELTRVRPEVYARARAFATEPLPGPPAPPPGPG
ncbi:NACHT domain-containing protein [Streptomyces sp. NPDC020965]|uniref:NACHT domain-containing protein n=1 Tax=Streptomyces sp. NPDC020965 TaxID=3365105 RepID=UPI0037A44AB1